MTSMQKLAAVFPHIAHTCRDLPFGSCLLAYLTRPLRLQGGKSEIEQKYAKRMVMRDEYM